MNDQQRLEHLILAAQHPCVSIITSEEQHALELLGAVTIGSTSQYWRWTVLGGIRAGLFEDGQPVAGTENPAAALYHLAYQTMQPCVAVMLDMAAHLRDERTLRAARETIDQFRKTGSTLILLDHDDCLPPVLTVEAARMDISLPEEPELEQIVRATIKQCHQRRAIEVKLTRSQLQTVVRNLRGLTRRQAEQIIVDSVMEDRQFNIDDVGKVLAHKRQRLHHGGVLQYVEAPVSLDEIGGLSRLKEWLRQRREALSEKAVEFGITPPRGVLLLGVQGAGKSLSAKAFATAWQRPLLRLDPGALYDRFIGESERRLRDALHQAEMMAPLVLWIDEIEKGFASAASHSVDGGLSQRMFGELLTWMQEHTAPVFLVATANNIDALPPELLRKGRFDEIFFIDLPTASVRRQIFSIHLARRKRDPKTFDLPALAAASDGYSGAEIEQAIVSALHEAFADETELTTKGLLHSLRTSPPLSVTMAERVAMTRQWARDRCVAAE